MEPPLDKQGCNETVGDEAEYIAARGFPSWDLSLTDWMSGGRIDRPTDMNCRTFCFDCVLLLTKCCSCLSCCLLCFSPSWTIKISISTVALQQVGHRLISGWSLQALSLPSTHVFPLVLWFPTTVRYICLSGDCNLCACAWSSDALLTILGRTPMPPQDTWDTPSRLDEQNEQRQTMDGRQLRINCRFVWLQVKPTCTTLLNQSLQHNIWMHHIN